MADLASSRADAHERAWQRRLLPLMAGILVAAGLFFAAVSLFELRDFYERVEHRPLELRATFDVFENSASPTIVGDLGYLRFKTLALLEADALQRRYHQANATMLARVWTRQLGFITGMLLALVGAAFILGRLREQATKMEAEAQGLKGALESSSPGLALAVLGTTLMALTLWVPFGVETRDLNTYLGTTAIELPPPPPVDSLERERQLFPRQRDGAGSPTGDVSHQGG